MDLIRQRIRSVIELLFENTETAEKVDQLVTQIISGKIPKITLDSSKENGEMPEFNYLTKNLMWIYKYVNEKINPNAKKHIEDYLMYAFLSKGKNSLIIKQLLKTSGIDYENINEKYVDLVLDVVYKNFIYAIQNYNNQSQNFKDWVLFLLKGRVINKLESISSYIENGKKIFYKNIPLDKENDLVSPGKTEQDEKKEELSKVILDYLMNQIVSGRIEPIIIEKLADGLKRDEIAEEMGLASNNVGQHLWRITSKMTDDIRSGKFAKYIKSRTGFDIYKIPRIKNIADGRDKFTFYFVGLN